MKDLIILFSGNGNTLFLAKQLKNSELHFVEEVLSGSYTLPSKIERLGIMTPIYNHGVPHSMMRFIKEVLASRDNSELGYVYAVTTNSGRLGSGNFYLERLLREAGIALAYSASVKMPETDLRRNKHPLSEMKTLAFANKETKEIEHIVKDIENNEIKLPRLNPFFNIRYSIIKHLNRPKQYKKLLLDSSKCNGCAICRDICPMNNITLNKSGKAERGDSCILCFACHNRCPELALSFKRVKGQYKGLVSNEGLKRR